eukprot:CAMPEP_0117431290 /NCGR_PEP_ID=MMETSP0758-20121206/10826_1 /TAXON_ID=63605 /ORGANISM="Percolomonas cosmopolitus, Strain AE-1 (ATCC 50343)" /LENGTH=160 /DNA_ID=CAMNT_0005220155 /DNA_START=466 /DNA_END=948 /DNA_ORIENTATION=-
MNDIEKTPTIVATLNYYNCLEEKDVEKKTLSFISRVENCPTQEPNSKVDEERNRVLAAETMEQINLFGAQGRFDEAKKVLRQNICAIQSSKSSAKAEDMLMEMEQCNDFLAPQSYASGGAHQLASNFSGWGKQRATGTRQKSMAKHSNKKKSKLLNLFSA